MSDDLLQQIQQMQFTDRRAAEGRLLQFIRKTFPLDVQTVELNPSAVSLNSFNGFLTLSDGKRLFFKTHTESDNVIGEYYRASVLAEAGYPVIQPLYSSTEAGKHLLIYEVIDDPSVFDVAWQIENGDETHVQALTVAQNRADDDLLRLYRKTLQAQSAEDAAGEPIHQLFHHRLTKGRLERFYGPLPGKPGEFPTIQLPHGDVSMQDVRQMRWEINGQQYNLSLNQIIQQAIELLNPAQAGQSVVGHGDAHNGNVFLRLSEDPPTMLYFDPAFAGRHHPLLDLTKPLFHNVFAMWMYFPAQKRDQITITLEQSGDVWRIEHNYALHPIREMFLASKAERVLVPILRDMQRDRTLRADWRAYLKAALFCCPFLTMNLADIERFSSEISLLGLCMAIEMGAESRGKRSRIDRVLDGVQQQLGELP